MTRAARGADTRFARGAIRDDALATGPKPACLVLDADPAVDWAEAGADACLPLLVTMDVLLGVLQPLMGERPRGEARTALAPEDPRRAA